jgi:hypothetical protein
LYIFIRQLFVIFIYPNQTKSLSNAEAYIGTVKCMVQREFSDDSTHNRHIFYIKTNGFVHMCNILAVVFLDL